MERINNFIKSERISGVLLIVSTLIALIWANSQWGDFYTKLWDKTYLTIGFGKAVLSKPLYYWINDGLMAVFFFVVGLEIKREIIVGKLSEVKSAMLPVMAAIGGIAIPALIFFVFNYDDKVYANGWAIPVATDIAFSLGILAMIKGVPISVKIFLTALAIVDDIGAVASIAVFYTEEINWIYLIIAFSVFIFMFILNKLGVRNTAVYGVLAVAGLWLPMLLSGVHATIAGILAAFTIPAARKIKSFAFADLISKNLENFKSNPEKESRYKLSKQQLQSIDYMHTACEMAGSPMQQMEHQLHKIALYIIMPIFALANTGIIIEIDVLNQFFTHPVSLGILFGLFIGKPLGVYVFTWIGKKLKLGKLPKGMTMKQILGIGFLGGIGFTMSLFITDLAFHGDELTELSKKAIFLASFLSALVAYILFNTKTKKKTSNKNNI